MKISNQIYLKIYFVKELFILKKKILINISNKSRQNIYKSKLKVTGRVDKILWIILNQFQHKFFQKMIKIKIYYKFKYSNNLLLINFGKSFNQKQIIFLKTKQNFFIIILKGFKLKQIRQKSILITLKTKNYCLNPIIIL